MSSSPSSVADRRSPAALVIVAHAPAGRPLRVRWASPSSACVAELLAQLPRHVDHVRYTDPDGDLCTVRSDAELAAAIQCAAVATKPGAAGRERRVLHVHYDAAVPAAAAAAPVAEPAAGVAAAGAAAPAADSQPVRALVRRSWAPVPAAKLAQLHERAATLGAKLAAAESDSPAAAGRLSQRLAAVNAKIAAHEPARAAAAPAAAPAPEPAVRVDAAAPVSAPGSDRFDALLARNAARAAAVEQKISDLRAAAASARAAGKPKCAANLDAAVVRVRQQAAKIAERRVALVDRRAAAAAPPAATPDTLPAAAPPVAATPADPWKLVRLATGQAAVEAQIAHLSAVVATVRANGHPGRAAAIEKRVQNLCQRAGRMEQRRRALSDKADGAASDRAAVAPTPKPKPAAGRGRGKPRFVTEHQLAKLKERRAAIDARIAELEAEKALLA